MFWVYRVYCIFLLFLLFLGAFWTTDFSKTFGGFWMLIHFGVFGMVVEGIAMAMRLKCFQ